MDRRIVILHELFVEDLKQYLAAREDYDRVRAQAHLARVGLRAMALDLRRRGVRVDVP